MIYCTEENINLPSGISVLYFFSFNMPFLNRMNNVLDKLEILFPANYYKIDCDKSKKLCLINNIDSAPTVLVFNNGIEKLRMPGVGLYSTYKSNFIKIFKENNATKK